MRGRAWSLALITLVALLAGCTTSDDLGGARGDSDEPEQKTQDSRLERELLGENGTRAPLAPATAADWFLMTGKTGPDAPLTAFNWTVPPRSVHEVPIFEGSSVTDQRIPLEIVLVLDADGPILEWALLLFKEVNGDLTLARAIVDVPLHAVSSLAVVETPQTHQPSLDPFQLLLRLDDFVPGDTVHFVITAVTAQEGEIAFAMRVRDDQDVPLAQSPEELRARSGDRPPRLPERSGTGAGFQHAMYVDYIFFTALGVRMWSDAVLIDDRSPLAIGTVNPHQDITLAATFPSGGWGSGALSYFAGSGVGIWDIDLDVHGTRTQQRGWTVEAPLFFPSIILTGLPYVRTVAEGPSGTHAEFTVQTSGVTDRQFHFEVLDIGATLPALFGLNATTSIFNFPGLLPPPPVFLIEGDALHIQYADHAHTTLRGGGHLIALTQP